MPPREATDDTDDTDDSDNTDEPDEPDEGGEMEARSDMTIWVDADAMPRDVREILFRASLRLEIPMVLVANQRIATPANNPYVSTVLVRKGLDVADQHIVEEAVEGDVAVTADIPLAAALVEKGLVVLDPRGETWTEANVRERLSIRDFMDSLRSTGVETGGPSAFSTRDKQNFANALDRILTAAGLND